MTLQKRPTSLVDPLPKPKSKLWHQDGVDKRLGSTHFSGPGWTPDDAKTHRRKMRGEGGWTQRGTVRVPESDTDRHVDDISANKNRHPARFARWKHSVSDELTSCQDKTRDYTTEILFRFHENLGCGVPTPTWLVPIPTGRIVVVFGVGFLRTRARHVQCSVVITLQFT